MASLPRRAHADSRPANTVPPRADISSLLLMPITFRRLAGNASHSLEAERCSQPLGKFRRIDCGGKLGHNATCQARMRLGQRTEGPAP